MLEWLRSDPQGFLTFMLYRTPAVLIALVLHECAHGYVAHRCGDDTAKNMGRLSLNPLRHMDPIGTVLMFLIGMGWAKPVPVNPQNFRHGRRDDVLVSLAGVTVNLILFVLATLVSIGLNELIWQSDMWGVSPLVTRENFLCASGENYMATIMSYDHVFGLAAGEQYYVYPMADVLRTPWLLYVQRFVLQLATINLGLMLFNLLPFPPLDGFHVFNDILLKGRLRLSGTVFRVCMAALMALMFFTDFISDALSSAMNFVQGGFVRLLLSLFGLA